MKAVRLAAVALAVLLPGCSDDPSRPLDPPPPPPPPEPPAGVVAAIVVSPLEMTAIGDTAWLAATAVDAYGDVVPGVAIRFRALGGSAAEIDSTGRVIAHHAGMRAYEARADTIVTHSAVNVRPVARSLRLSARIFDQPAPGGTVHFFAEALDARGHEASFFLLGTELRPMWSASIKWASLDTTVVQFPVDDNVAKLRSPGTARIVASLAEVVDTMSFTVYPPLVLTPRSASIAVQESVQARPSLEDRAAPVTWSVHDPSIVGITADYTVVGLTPGLATLTATSMEAPARYARMRVAVTETGTAALGSGSTCEEYWRPRLAGNWTRVDPTWAGEPLQFTGDQVFYQHWEWFIKSGRQLVTATGVASWSYSPATGCVVRIGSTNFYLAPLSTDGTSLHLVFADGVSIYSSQQAEFVRDTS